jgi:tRNA threonylcarbamoyladenosine modification (KEOPS) complex  Pcc1 subunit
LEAEIVVEYDGAKIARAVAEAVSPDNFKTPRNLSVKTTVEGKKVITRIEHHGKLPTFIATIDDLLFSVCTAENTLQTTKKL